MKLAISAVIFSAALAAPLAAQSGAPPAPPAPGMHHGGPHGPHGGPFGPAAHRVEPIANAPFTAQFTETGTFTTREGKQVQQSSTSIVYRDSQGRVREEVTLPAPPPRPPATGANGTVPTPPAAPRGPRTIVTIVDPVAHTITHLNAEKQTAYVQTVPADFFTHLEQREDARAAGQQSQHQRNNATTTSLGTQVFSGVSATGEQTVITFPARDGGSAHTMTHQSWFSPDLKLEVSATETGDRGTHTETLTGLTKSEPSPSLFQVPSGYTTEAAPNRHFGGSRRGGPGGPSGPGGDNVPPPPPSM